MVPLVLQKLLLLADLQLVELNLQEKAGLVERKASPPEFRIDPRGRIHQKIKQRYFIYLCFPELVT